jgi:superfamily II DNA/RNA helicase
MTIESPISVAEVTEASFADFALSEPIQRAVAQMGYRTPTPVQAAAIPVVMTGRDVMAAAQTGTGKTAGFALPILQRLLPLASSSPSPARHPVRALVLAPTRELADQIFVNFRDYAQFTALRAACVYGGVDIAPQIAQLRLGCEVLIATPGRLLDHVGQRNVNLSQVQILVLDEADRMLDMGFMPDLQRILTLLPPVRQSLMFSATFSEEIKKLAGSFLKMPQLIEVARRNSTAENVTQQVFLVDRADAKRAAVAHLVKSRGLKQVIVFSNTKIGCARLARELIRDGLNAEAIHGDKSQQDRQKTLDAFKAGEISVLVATDVAARGLDIAELPAVINYDLPYSPEDYIHRIGRTGRAGASGIALSLMVAGDERLREQIEKLIGRKLKVEALEGLPQRERADGFGDEIVERGARVGARAHTKRSEGEISHTRLARPVRTNLPGWSSDRFFFQPYEPSAAALEHSSLNETTPAPRGPRRGSRMVATLLGGKPPA